MAPRDVLQPSLLDRLTDERPGARQESRDTWVMSIENLRAAVIRDLSWLLNTEDLSAVEDLEPFPEVAKSVLNYGRPALAGRTFSKLDRERLSGNLRKSIENFEPRIRSSSLKVRIVESEEPSDANALTFEIEGELWAEPVPLHMLLRTKVDLDTGEISIENRG